MGHLGWSATGGSMGAAMSDCSEFEDPGPPVTKERILRAIKSWEGAEDVEVEEIVEKEGNAKGEGFMSSLAFINVKAKVNGEAKSYDWVVKSTPREANRAHLSMNMASDEREAEFYSTLMPMLKKFLAGKGLESLLPTTSSIPYSSWTEDEKVLIMQDLHAEGWRDAINKKKGLDVHHLRKAFKWLGRYHAITAAFLEEFPGGEDEAKKHLPLFFYKFCDWPWLDKVLDQFAGPSTANLRQILGQIDERRPGGHRVNRLNALIKDIGLMHLVMKQRDEQEFHLKTIGHCDPWFNNMMFRYGEDLKPESVMFIDFQLVTKVCPAIDVAYFLAPSTTGEVRKEHLEHLLTVYHTTLTSTLDILQSNISYTYEQFREDYKHSLLWGFNFAVGALPNVLAEKEEDVADMEEFFTTIDEDDEEKKKAFEELMKKEQEKVTKSDVILERLGDLWDEMVEAGAI